MTTRRKATTVEQPATEQLQHRIEQLREQVVSLAGDKRELAAQLEAMTKASERPAREFETEKIRVNGFTITIAGKDCSENQVWIERVGDTVVILTGAAAEARRRGDIVSPIASSAVQAVAAPSREQSWTNLTPAAGASMMGLGPSPDLSEEEKARLLLEGMERSIIERGGIQ